MGCNNIPIREENHVSDNPTPNDMPSTAEPAETVEAKPTQTVHSFEDDTFAQERAELERLRAIHKDESKWEKRAKQNFDDAERWRKLTEQLGGDKGKEFDPQAEIARLRDDFTKSEKARIKSEVARTEGVDPEDFTGDTEEQMRESARRYKAKIEAAIEKALKGRAPSAAPATEVTSNGKVDGAKQITSRDELRKMSPKEILQAKEDGRLDSLMGRS